MAIKPLSVREGDGNAYNNDQEEPRAPAAFQLWNEETEAWKLLGGKKTRTQG